MSDLDPGADLGPEDLELGRRLSAVSSSRDASKRDALRARLLARGPAAPRPSLRLAALSLVVAGVVLMLAQRGERAHRAAPRFARGAHGLPVLPGRLDADPTAVARVEETPKGQRLLWEVDGDRFVLESRRITIDDIIVRR